MVSYNPQLPLFSLHIPRTGGTSFRYVLRLWFKDRLFLHYRHNVRPLCLHDYQSTGICIHGHRARYMADWAPFPDTVQYVAFFREPFSRFVSTWHFQRKLLASTHPGPAPRIGPDTTFCNYLENTLKRWRTRRTRSQILRFMPRVMTATNFEDIFHDLFIFCGVTEQLQLSVDLLAQCLGQPSVAVPRLNMGLRDASSDEYLPFFDRFRDFFSIDYDIYHAVVRRLSVNSVVSVVAAPAFRPTDVAHGCGTLRDTRRKTGSTAEPFVSANPDTPTYAAVSCQHYASILGRALGRAEDIASTDNGGVIFDMDGTMLDTEIKYRTAFFEAMSLVSGFRISNERYQRLVGLSSIQRRLLLKRYFGPSFPLDEFCVEYKRLKTQALADGIRLKHGAIELIQYFKARHISVSVVTSAGHNRAYDSLKSVGVYQHLSTVITRDDVSRSKPHPEPFLAAALKTRLSPRRCIALDDSYYGIRAARAAGMIAIFVRDGVTLSGKRLETCAAIVDDLDEVREIFELIYSPNRQTYPATGVSLS